MKNFREFWINQCKKFTGYYIINIWNEQLNKFEYFLTNLTVAIAYAETLATDHLFNPENVKIVEIEKEIYPLNSKFERKTYTKRIAIAQNEPSNQSPVHKGYVIWFGTKSHKVFDKYFSVYLT